MEQLEEHIAESIRDFHLPRYAEVPALGLYLEQVANYLDNCLQPLGDVKITSSMISNYVKHDLIDRPHKKQYGREQIADLMIIALAKNVLPLDDLRIAIKIQQNSEHSLAAAYDYFCTEFEHILKAVFGFKPKVTIKAAETAHQRMLRNLVITICYKVYLDKYFHFIREGE